MKINITRRSKVGFGYTAGCVQGEHGLEIADVDKPDYVGTIRQVLESTNSDRTLASFSSGGTYYNTQWFVKVNNKWHKIIDNYANPIDLLEPNESGWKSKYWTDELDMEVEE